MNWELVGNLVYPPDPSCTTNEDCDDGLHCNGVETCDGGSCQAGAPPACDDGVSCTVDTCNEAMDNCDALPDDGLCDNGMFCDGAETCDPGAGCQPASDPCTPLGCDDVNDQCITGAVARLETHVVSADSTFQSVALTKTYVSPVVVCSPQYAANSLPIVTRVQNVTTTSFEVRLQNPSGNAIVSDLVHCLVVEEGVWEVEGLKIEAFRYDSTVTNNESSWAGESQSYGQSYSSPVVLGQVMTRNDIRWSVFWDSGSWRGAPPNSTVLRTGKHVGGGPDTDRADETVGVIVLEARHGTLGGIEYEAALGTDIVAGVVNSPPYDYSFSTPFAATPTVAVVTQAAMDGGRDGSWAQLFGATPLSASTIGLAVDEDQVADSDRSHTTERVAYVVFAGEVSYSQ